MKSIVVHWLQHGCFSEYDPEQNFSMVTDLGVNSYLYHIPGSIAQTLLVQKLVDAAEKCCAGQCVPHQPPSPAGTCSAHIGIYQLSFKHICKYDEILDLVSIRPALSSKCLLF